MRRDGRSGCVSSRCDEPEAFAAALGYALVVGATLDINEECVGVIVEETSEQIKIESKVFTGWATKAEIIEAINEANEPRSPHTRP